MSSYVQRVLSILYCWDQSQQDGNLQRLHERGGKRVKKRSNQSSIEIQANRDTRPCRGIAEPHHSRHQQPASKEKKKVIRSSLLVDLITSKLVAVGFQSIWVGRLKTEIPGDYFRSPPPPLARLCRFTHQDTRMIPYPVLLSARYHMWCLAGVLWVAL